MNFHFITLMPELIQQGLDFGVVGSAFKKQICSAEFINPRTFATDNHQTVDDRPFGGGDGMLMMAEPLQKSIDSLSEPGEIYYLSPQGEVFNDSLCKELSSQKKLTFICGRYGGVDQRFLTKNKIKEISIGDYVLSGGELAALVITDAVVRQIPGVLGHGASAYEDSFKDNLLEAPYFTRPQSWQEMEVPATLLSGDHKKIADYKMNLSILTTLQKRPDLLRGRQVDWFSIVSFFVVLLL